MLPANCQLVDRLNLFNLLNDEHLSLLIDNNIVTQQQLCNLIFSRPVLSTPENTARKAVVLCIQIRFRYYIKYRWCFQKHRLWSNSTAPPHSVFYTGMQIFQPLHFSRPFVFILSELSLPAGLTPYQTWLLPGELLAF